MNNESENLIKELTNPKRASTPLKTKLEVLSVYANEHDKSIANIGAIDKFEHDGIIYPIGRWIRHFRAEKDKLDAQTIMKLNDLGMLWKGEKHTESHHQNLVIALTKRSKELDEKKIEILTIYSKSHNGSIGLVKEKDIFFCNGEFYPIGRWVSYYRSSKKDLDIKFKHKLEDIGMVWEKSRGRRTKSAPKTIKKPISKERKLEILSVYAQSHDNSISKVMGTETYEFEGVTYPIGCWILYYRKNKDRLDDETIEKLNELGMLWQGKMGRPLSDEYYRLLNEFELKL